MKKILHRVLSVVVIASAGSAESFSLGGEFQKNPPIALSKTSGGVGGGISSNYTKVFVTDAPSVIAADDVTLNDERLRGEDPVKVAKMDMNAIVNTGIIVVAALAILTQTEIIDSGMTRGICSLQETALEIPTDIWNSYSEVLSSSPIQTKAVTSATVYTIGDMISQRTEGVSMGELDRPRVVRSLLAGLLGHGPLSHVWYGLSENIFENVLHLPNDIFGTAAKVAIDQTTWGPFWNNTYILMLGLMKLDSPKTIWAEMKRTTVPLLVSGLKLWPLAHCVTYGLVPVENRLLWVDFVEIFWVTILATTAAAGNDDNQDVQNKL